MDEERRRFSPPNDEAPESWLRRFDSKPQVLPSWPPLAGLVAIVVRKPEGAVDTEAFVCTTQADMEAEVDNESGPALRLFFQIPRAVLLRMTDCQLKPEDFKP